MVSDPADPENRERGQVVATDAPEAATEELPDRDGRYEQRLPTKFSGQTGAEASGTLGPCLGWNGALVRTAVSIVRP
jgi:hypothetical protein